MASLKAIRTRITSVRNTQQVTKAMKMVAAAKLRRAQASAENARAYADKLTELLQNLAAASGADAHPLLRPGADVPAHAVAITGDKGLCGGYNANVIRLVDGFMASDDGRDATLTMSGRRGRDHYKRRGRTMVSEHVNIASDAIADLAKALAAEAGERFLEAKAGAVYLIFTRFTSAISQEAVIERLLPVTADAAESHAPADYVYEPSAAAILATLLPRYVETKVYHALLEAAASEHGARMTAMESATNNASDMIDRLTLEMNRARQAGITTELMEIVGGAEALKG